MSKNTKTAFKTRIHRRIHRWISIPFFLFFVIIGTTAILLAWKKELGLIPETQSSKVDEASPWLQVESILEIAANYASDSLQKEQGINRLDFRPDKGIVKVIFKYHFTEIQIDGFSGEILSVKQRNSDLIEKIHDGSIVDFLLPSGKEHSKLFYSTFTSLGLIMLCISGFYLWYNPKLMKNRKHRVNS